MASTVVYLRQSPPGGDPPNGIYDTIAGCVAASSSGTGAGDRSKIVPLDSATYNEQIDFGALNWIDIEVVPGSGCAPVFTYRNQAIVAGPGANNIRMIGDPGSKPVYTFNPGSGSGHEVLAIASGCTFSMANWDFTALTGSSNILLGGAGGTCNFSFSNCNCLGGTWGSPLQPGNIAGTVTLFQCNWLPMTISSPIITDNTAVLDIQECRLKGSTLGASWSSLGTPGGAHHLANSIFVQSYNATHPHMVGFAAATYFHSVGFLIEDCEVIGTNTVGSYGFFLDYAAAGHTVRNLIITDFKKSWHSTLAWSPTYSCSWNFDTTPYSGNATAGAGMIEADPLLDANYEPGAGSPVIDAGTISGLTNDILGNPRPMGAGEDMGAFERLVIQVVSASCSSRTEVVVELDSAPTGDILDPAFWSIEDEDGVSDGVTITGLDAGATSVTLTVEYLMTPGGLYSATCSAPIIDPAADSAEFIVGVTLTEAKDSGLWEALTGALGTSFETMWGAPATRTTSDTSPGATRIYVESTYGFDDSGVVQVGPWVITYGSKTGLYFDGLEWELLEDPDNPGSWYSPEPFVAPAGTRVEPYDRTWSLVGQAKASVNPVLASEEELFALATDLGFPKPIYDMTDIDLREYLASSMFMTRSTWASCYKVLRPLLRWASVSGTGAVGEEVSGVVYLKILTVDLGSNTNLHDRWIVVNGTLCRSKYWYASGSYTYIELESNSHAWWSASPISDGDSGIEWEILAFRVVPLNGSEPVDASGSVGPETRGGSVLVRAYLPIGTVPATYLMGSSIKIPDGRPIAGKIMADSTVSGEDVWPLYLGPYYKTEILEALREVLAAPVFYRVEQLPR